jgi:hypothetical protein
MTAVPMPPLPTPVVAADVTPMSSDLHSAVGALRSDLAQNRLSASQSLAALRAAIPDEGKRALLDRLAECIALLDYPAAMAALDTLARDLGTETCA